MAEKCGGSAGKERLRQCVPCCLGALLAVLVAGLHRSGAMVFAMGIAGWKPFAAAFFGGLAVLGAALVLFYVREPFGCFPEPRRLRWRLRVAGAGALVAAAGWLAPLPLLAAGALTGAGTGFLLLAWLDWFAARTMAFRFAGVGAAFAVAAAISIALFYAPAPLVPLAAIVLIAVSWLGLLVPVQETFSMEVAHPDGEGLSPRDRLRSFSAGTWRPLVGALITVFVFGFTWDTDMMRIALNSDAPLACEKVAAMILGAVLFASLGRFAHHGGDAQRVLFNIVLPLMVLVFVIRPYFLDMPTGALALTLLGVLRELGFALFLGAAWIAVADAARESDVSVGFGAGVLLAGFGACGLSGMGATYFLGSLASYLGAILFTLYLIVIAIVNAPLVEGGSAAPVPEVDAPGDLEAAIARHCEALSAQWALTARESEVMSLLARGHSYPYIAKELVVSENTIRTHVRNVYRKARIGSREELIALIHQQTAQ